MKYIVKGELMEFFDAEAELDLTDASIDGEYSAVELCEVAGTVMYAQTGNFRMACWQVVALAFATGCESMLRIDIPEVAEEYAMQMREIEDAEE